MVLFLLLTALFLFLQERPVWSSVPAVCFAYGADGLGGERGPRIRSDRGDLAKLIREGAGGMPAMNLTDSEMDMSGVVRRMMRANAIADIPAGPFTPAKGRRGLALLSRPVKRHCHSTLRQINTANVQQLAPRWMFNVTSDGCMK